MTDSAVVHLAFQVMKIAFELAAPVLITALAVGFLVSMFQSATQIQEFTLSFVPKVVAIGIVLLFSGRWMLHSMVTFTHQLFDQLPSLLK
ncbi:MAG TPA: flagellar biosynthesis protein FliQ [Mycobacterium sp.]|nr:flagellar biosynthesis protein FliQ [Mycobacterium sp.]